MNKLRLFQFHLIRPKTSFRRDMNDASGVMITNDCTFVCHVQLCVAHRLEGRLLRNMRPLFDPKEVIPGLAPISRFNPS